MYSSPTLTILSLPLISILSAICTYTRIPYVYTHCHTHTVHPIFYTHLPYEVRELLALYVAGCAGCGPGVQPRTTAAGEGLGALASHVCGSAGSLQ